MMNIEIATSPFELMDHIHTRLVADGDPHWFDGRNNRLYRHVVCMPMTRWLIPYQERLSVWPGFLSALSREANERAFHFRFFGKPEAYEVFCREVAFQRDQLEREQLEVSFSHAGQPDAQKLKAQMRKLLLKMQDELIFNRQDNKNANQLRRQLDAPQLKLETVRDDGAVLILRIGSAVEEPAEASVCLAFDSTRMSPLQMETEYLRLLEEHGCKNGHSLRCRVIHPNQQMAEQAATRLQESLRYRNVCAWPVRSAASREEVVQGMEAYMHSGYEEDVYLPGMLARCVEMIRQHADHVDFRELALDDWNDFCDLLLQDEQGGES